MSDPYLYEDVPVLKNELGIKNEKTLDRIEAEQSRANMRLLSGWKMLDGMASAGKNSSISSLASFRRSGRCTLSGRAIPERL